ncbi:uncharacterized protein LOC141912750 isoform X2 [Tubulanus polymorphus]|uniref:uncharacterized protein LOC141912750 isoform X2 n=1 Tax=Tubulanus polymorphus TaxID=672921 RepID=UPI003DA6BB22
MASDFGPGDSAYWPAAVNIVVPIVMVILFIVALVIVSFIKNRVPPNEDADIEAKVAEQVRKEEASRIKELNNGHNKVSFDTKDVQIHDDAETPRPSTSSDRDLNSLDLSVRADDDWKPSNRKRTVSCTETVPPKDSPLRRMRTYSQRSHQPDIDADYPVNKRRTSISSIVSAISNFSQIDRNFELNEQYEYRLERQRKISGGSERSRRASSGSRPRSLSDLLPGAASRRHRSQSQLETITSGVQLQTPAAVAASIQVELHDGASNPAAADLSELDASNLSGDIGTRV